eukprot:403454-Pyramimonas_sp.AAC.1
MAFVHLLDSCSHKWWHRRPFRHLDVSPCLLEIVAAHACAGASASAELAYISSIPMSSKLLAYLTRPPCCFSRSS